MKVRKILISWIETTEMENILVIVKLEMVDRRGGREGSDCDYKGLSEADLYGMGKVDVHQPTCVIKGHRMVALHCISISFLVLIVLIYKR